MDTSGDDGRRRLADDAPDPKATGTQRDTQAAGYQFYKTGTAELPADDPRADSASDAYFDDSYAVNSANNGPYGDAITKDLIPTSKKNSAASDRAGRA